MATPLLNAFSKSDRDRLLSLADEVTFPEGSRLFREGDSAERFWVVRTGTVHLRVRVDERHEPTVEMLGHGDLLGWSWLVPPRTWQVSAEAFTPVRAFEFDAAQVRALCNADPVLGLALTRRVLEVVANRLQATRMRLLDTYAPYSDGTVLVPD